MQKIKLPRRFKDMWYTRFNPDHAIYVPPEYKGETGKWKIYVANPFCKFLPFACKKCPFSVVQINNKEEEQKLKCDIWIENIIKNRVFGDTENTVWWSAKYDKRARRQLNSLRKKMEKLIIWVD